MSMKFKIHFGLDYIQTMEEVSNVSTKMVVWGLRLTFYWKTVGHASKCTLDYKGRYLQPCNDSNQEKKTYCLVRQKSCLNCGLKSGSQVCVFAELVCGFLQVHANR